MGIAFTWLCGLCQQFHTIAIGRAFLHIRFRVPFHLGGAITSPFAAWYLSEMSNPNALERDNAFLFLKIALHLHTDGLLPKKSQKAKKHIAKCRPCIFRTLIWSFTVPFRETSSTDFWLHFPKRVCGAGTLEWMRAAKAANFQVQGKEPGGGDYETPQWQTSLL